MKVHTGFVLIFTVVATVLMLNVQAQPVSYPDVFNEQMDSDDTKDLLVKNLLMNLLMSQEHNQAGSYNAETLRDPDVKKALLTKKIHSMCHFKLCNLGRR